MRKPSNSGMTPFRVGMLVGILAFAFIGGTMAAGMWGWTTWYRLSSMGQKAEARVTATRPEFHQTCEFEFLVGNTAHEGSASGCSAAVREFVDITYLPTDRSFATLRNPKEELVGQVVGSLGMSAFAGLVAGIRAWRWQQKQS